MLNPAYSLDEQAEELLAEAESLLEVAIVPIYTTPKLETWIADLPRVPAAQAYCGGCCASGRGRRLKWESIRLVGS